MRRLTPIALALVVASGIGQAQQHTVEPARDEADQTVSGFSSNGDTQLNDYIRFEKATQSIHRGALSAHC